MQKYIKKYKNAKQDLSNPVNQNLVKFSTLQYFEEEIGIISEGRKNDGFSDVPDW